MAIFTIKTESNQLKLFQDIFKFTSLFIIFHILVNISEINNLGLFSSNLLNYDFLMFIILLIVTFSIYYLILLEIIEII